MLQDYLRVDGTLKENLLILQKELGHKEELLTLTEATMKSQGACAKKTREEIDTLRDRIDKIHDTSEDSC